MMRAALVALLFLASPPVPAGAQTTAEEQFELADRYFTGEGVAKDVPTAIAWYRKAAEQGHASAQLVLGMMHAKGDHVSRDLPQAAAWFRKAADQGEPTAQRRARERAPARE